MGMSYSKNPNLPKVRAEAVKMLRSGQSTRAVARHFGFSQSTIVKWNKKVPPNTYQCRVIPTESSRPRHHPNELDEEIVRQILDYRQKTGRGAEFIHFLLARDGAAVSISSVKRTLSRHGLTKYSSGRSGTKAPLDHYLRLQDYWLKQILSTMAERMGPNCTYTHSLMPTLVGHMHIQQRELALPEVPSSL